MSNRNLSRLSGALLAATAATVVLFLGGGAAAHAAAPPAAPSTGRAQPVELRAGAPCVVTGYSLHAQQEMDKDHIGSDYVENVVYEYCRRATWQKHKKTWRYTDRKIVVIANTNG